MPNPGNPQAFNRYAYTLGNPLRYTDPTGHWSCGDQYDPSCIENAYEAYLFKQMSGDGSYFDNMTAAQDEFADTRGSDLVTGIPALDAILSPAVSVRYQWDFPGGRVLAQGRVSGPMGDYEWELGLKDPSVRLGTPGDYLVTRRQIRMYSSDNNWAGVGPTEFSAGQSVYKGQIGGQKVDVRGVQSMRMNSNGVVQATGTIELNMSERLGSTESRWGYYLRVSTNAYPKRYATVAAEVGVVTTVAYGGWTIVAAASGGAGPIPANAY